MTHHNQTSAEATAGIEVISLDESKRLVSLETLIKRGLATFLEVGEALMEIRDSRLYRIEHASFEDWKRCQAAFVASHVAKFAEHRGFPIEFVEKLRDAGLLGFYKNSIAVPVIDPHGVCIGAQYFPKGSRGFYSKAKREGSDKEDVSITAYPLIIGDIRKATRVIGFESQWDMYAYYERCGLPEGEALISTRGVDHAAKLAGRVPESAEFICFRQNDGPDERGKIADDDWFKVVLDTLDRPTRSVRVPDHLKDLNDWTREGATSGNILAAIIGGDVVGIPAHAERFMDPQAELCVLGSMIASNEVFAAMTSEVSADYFASKRGALLFGAIVDLTAKRLPLNSMSVARELESVNGASEAVGGFHAIAGLPALQAVPDVMHEVERLRHLALSREVVQTARQLSLLGNSANPLEALAKLGIGVDRLREKQRGFRPGALPEMEDAFELLINPPPEPVELIVGVLHRGMKGTVGGSSKSFKTWCLVDMAVSVATGTDWWGFPTVKGRVAYINFEVPKAFFAKRLKYVSDAKGVTPKKSDLLVWNLRGHSAPMAVIGPKIIETIRRAGDVSLIILDPLYKLMAGMDENSAGDVGSLCIELDKLATETGAAIAYGSHFSKGNQALKDAQDRISGSGVTARDPDAIITLTKHVEEGAFVVDSVLRNHSPVDSFVVRWDFPLMKRDGGLDPTMLKKQKTGREAIYGDDDLLQHLKDGEEMSASEWQRAVKEECGMSEGSFHSKRRALLAAKKIRKSPISGKWCLK